MTGLHVLASVSPMIGVKGRRLFSDSFSSKARSLRIDGEAAIASGRGLARRLERETFFRRRGANDPRIR